MRQKLAIFVGGSCDGQRRAVERWDRTMRVLIADRVRVPLPNHMTEMVLQTFEEQYVMPVQPIEPREFTSPDMSSAGIPDAEFGIYFFAGSQRVHR